VSALTSVNEQPFEEMNKSWREQQGDLREFFGTTPDLGYLEVWNFEVSGW
jgi:hypothetical protein